MSEREFTRLVVRSVNPSFLPSFCLYFRWPMHNLNFIMQKSRSLWFLSYIWKSVSVKRLLSKAYVLIDTRSQGFKIPLRIKQPPPSCEQNRQNFVAVIWNPAFSFSVVTGAHQVICSRFWRGHGLNMSFITPIMYISCVPGEFTAGGTLAMD